MGTMCDILVSDKTRSTGAFFIAHSQTAYFGAKAPALFRLLTCPSCLVNRSNTRLFGAGALSFKSTINEPGKCANTYPALTHTIGGPTVSASGNIPRTPDSGQSLPLELLNRIHTATQDPTGRLVVALLRQLCPGLTPAMALEWIRADLAFEAEAVRQAAELLNGEWTESDSL